MKFRYSPVALAVFAALGSVTVTPATAQQTQPQAQSLERVTITGSNIRRTDQETVAPVEIITREQIERSGQATIADVIKTIPANLGGSYSESFANSFASGARGFRMTPQRMAILHILHHAGSHLSPSEIYAKARKELPGLTEPTVYRTLEFLVENELVRTSQSGSGHLTYQIVGRDHHHLVCRVCRGEIEVEHSLLASLYRTLEKASGYRKIDSHVTFFGVCPACAKA